MAPIPSAPDRIAKVLRSETVFSVPSADTQAKYFEKKQLCLRYLATIMSLETSILATDELVGNLPASDIKIQLAAATQWHIQTRLTCEILFKKALRRTVLHLQLRHEALANRKRNPLYVKLMNAEPSICDTLFPQEDTSFCLDQFKDFVVSVDAFRTSTISSLSLPHLWRVKKSSRASPAGIIKPLNMLAICLQGLASIDTVSGTTGISIIEGHLSKLRTAPFEGMPLYLENIIRNPVRTLPSILTPLHPPKCNMRVVARTEKLGARLAAFSHQWIGALLLQRRSSPEDIIGLCPNHLLH